MTRRRIRFVWSARADTTRRWRFGLWGRPLPGPDAANRRVGISVRGLLLWGAALGLAGYLVTATALYAWFARSPYNLISWSDTVLMPFRWAEVRELRGRMMVEEGLADWRAKRWSEAQVKLRVGLARAPGERRARLVLADFYVAVQRRPVALAMLADGVAGTPPSREYLTKLFRLAADGEDYGLIIKVCDQLAAAKSEDAAWLRTQKVSALLGAGRSAEVLAVIEQNGADAPAALREAQVLALFDLGRGEEALRVLEMWQREGPSDLASVLRLRVRAWRELKRPAEMQATLAQLRNLEPADPRVAVFGVVQCWLAGETAAANEALDDYFLRFASSSPALVLMANAVAEAKAEPLARRCVAEAAAHGFPAKALKLAWLQTQIAAADWTAASRTLVELRPAIPRDGAAEDFLFTWLERLVAVAAGPAEALQGALLDLLQQRALPLRLYRQSCETLLSAGQPEPAGRVLDLAERSYPASRTLAGLRAQVRAAAPKPATPPVEPAKGPEAPGEQEFFERMDALARAGGWAEAAQLIRTTRVAKPEWLERREVDVLAGQIRVAARTGDQLELIAGAQQLLNGDRGRSDRVLALAQEIREAGKTGDSDVLLREVLRHDPDYPPALRLKQAWTPPAPPTRS